MHLPKLITLVAAAAVALLGATVAQPTAGSSGVRVLRAAGGVGGFAADGSVAVVTTGCQYRGRLAGELQLLAWNPVRRSVISIAPQRQRKCYGASTGEGIWEQAIAGRRLAWVPYGGGNYREAWLVTATIEKPLSTRQLTGVKVRNTGSDLGDWVGNVHGDGYLLVFNTWSTCEWEPDFMDYPCPEGVPPHTFHIFNEKLWRIVGGRKRLLVASPDELAVLSVAAGRILVRRADGSLEVRRSDGGLLRAFPFRRGEVRAALLDASELVVLDHGSSLTWRVYDLVSGEQKRVFAAPGRAIAADVERGLLVYTVGRAVHVLRLADGHQKVFVAPVVKERGDFYPQPVHAQIEPSGLFYSYPVKREGRVRFVPFGEIRFR
jgi:hypothetical protein